MQASMKAAIRQADPAAAQAAGIEAALAQWHAFVAGGDAARLDALLADDVVFYSPVVHRPLAGRAITAHYLRAAFAVFGAPGFRYVRQVVGERDAVLEFEVELDGVHVNGVDLLRVDDAGRVIEFKVMLRPLKAVNLIHAKMGALLQGQGQAQGQAGGAAPAA